MSSVHSPYADLRLSKYNPLKRILFFDDFDEGVNGWCTLIGSYNDSLDDIKPIFRDLRPAQLSNCTFFGIGTHGSVGGEYAFN